MNTFFPLTGTETEWNAAFYRLEDYFRSLHLVNKVHQSQIILGLLERAAAKHGVDPSQNPTTLAMEETRMAMKQWLEGILPNRERIEVVGLLSLLSTEAFEQWPLVFLSGEVPADLRREMQESDLRAGPDLQISSMVPRPIDVGPLLDPFHLTAALEKAHLGLAIAAVILLSALSASLFLLMR